MITGKQAGEYLNRLNTMNEPYLTDKEVYDLHDFLKEICDFCRSMKDVVGFSYWNRHLYSTESIITNREWK